MTSLKFGTSGLRGLVEDLVGWPSCGHTKAFLGRMEATSQQGARRLLLGRDLRASSPAIAGACAAAADDMGWRVEDCGPIPTPALALESLRLAAPAIMITGSHIPDDRNGLKFYSPAGEIDKADEEAIAAGFEALGAPSEPRSEPAAAAAIQTSRDPARRYALRYLEAFGSDHLAGLRVGVYQHSTVARDLLVEILESLGATALPFARSDTFIPVDTEAHRPEDVALLAAFAAETAVDAIVSADGDADRPLVADAQGRILRGDTLGLMTARVLGVAEIVTPVTSSSAIEAAGAPARTRRTRVGSPFVVAGMQAAIRDGAAGVIGFEANGGVLLGTDVPRGERTLAALPTRDAVLPIVAVLGTIRRDARPLADVVAALGLGAAGADRLKNVPAEVSARLLAALAGDPAFTTTFLAGIGEVAGSSAIDGVRLQLASGEIVHYRASGNAPELRCYVEAATQGRAADLLEAGLARAASYVDGFGPP